MDKTRAQSLTLTTTTSDVICRKGERDKYDIDTNYKIREVLILSVLIHLTMTNIFKFVVFLSLMQISMLKIFANTIGK